ncbi:hypothetical protein ACHAWF_012108 [Thalassiosira exigua]
MGTDLSYYDILGIDENATHDQIRASYREMSKALHPDKNRFGTPLMKQINEAYETLSSPAKRSVYDSELNAKNGTSGNPTRIPIEPYLCMICNDIVNKEFFEASCCARLCCGSCLDAPVGQLDSLLGRHCRNVCPNMSCQQPITWPAGGGRCPVGWAFSSKFIQVQIDAIAPTHVCGKNVLPEYLNAHLIICPKMNTECFMCSGKGKCVPFNGYEVQCGACDGRRFLPGLDWTRCFKCNGTGAFFSVYNTWLNCSTCGAKGALKGQWTMCYRCAGKGAADCPGCNTDGALKGHWSRCYKCRGHGNDLNCICQTKGALEGKWTGCFKCEGVGWVTTNKGARNNCDACGARGGLEGFNAQPCRFCNGCGCANCSWKGWEKCECGSSCKGHEYGTIRSI